MKYNLQLFGGRGSGGGKSSGGGGGGLSKDSTTAQISEAFKGTTEGSRLEVIKKDGTTKTYTRTREMREDYIDKSEGGPRTERYVADEWGANLPNEDIVYLTGVYLRSGQWKSAKVIKK